MVLLVVGINMDSLLAVLLVMQMLLVVHHVDNSIVSSVVPTSIVNTTNTTNNQSTSSQTETVNATNVANSSTTISMLTSTAPIFTSTSYNMSYSTSYSTINKSIKNTESSTITAKPPPSATTTNAIETTTATTTSTEAFQPQSTVLNSFSPTKTTSKSGESSTTLTSVKDNTESHIATTSLPMETPSPSSAVTKTVSGDSSTRVDPTSVHVNSKWTSSLVEPHDTMNTGSVIQNKTSVTATAYSSVVMTTVITQVLPSWTNWTTEKNCRSKCCGLGGTVTQYRACVNNATMLNSSHAACPGSSVHTVKCGVGCPECATGSIIHFERLVALACVVLALVTKSLYDG